MGVMTVFEVEVPASSLALTETFERAPETTVQLERTVGYADGQPLRFVRVSGVESERAADLLAADPSVADAERLCEDGDADLFDVAFAGDIRTFVETIFDRGGVVLRATGVEGVWTFQLRFADRDDVGAVFDDDFADEYEATVTRLYGSNGSAANRSGLTRKQRRALDVAHDMGYYSVPRTVDLSAVGERLGISRQAVSERLRRAHEALVAEHINENGGTK